MTDIKQEVERYAEGAIRDADWLTRAIEGELGPEVRSHYDLDPIESVDWIDLLDVMALEVYGTKEVGPYRDDIVSITVITGSVGPHVEFEVDQFDNVTGRTYWGSESAEATGYLPGLFEALLHWVVRAHKEGLVDREEPHE